MKALLKLRQQLRQAELDYDAKVWNYTRQASASNEFRHFAFCHQVKLHATSVAKYNDVYGQMVSMRGVLMKVIRKSIYVSL